MRARDAFAGVCIAVLFACACAYCVYWLGVVL